MDRRYSSSSSSTATETAKKTAIGNALNSSIRFRNGLSSDSTVSSSHHHRKSFPSTSDVGSSFNSTTQHDDQFNSQYGLTQAGLEEYSRSYYEQNMMYNHQKQSSYAQSEGYHSYVSSSDSTSTPFLDRLRQDSQLLQSRAINWSSQDFQTQNLNGSTNSISSSTGNINNECSESNSSTETLKWLGSMSDVSVASQATNTSTLSASSQLIVHSSKVRTPQRHNSESVLYMNDEGKMNGTTNNSTEDLSSEQFQHRSSRSDNRLFPINTYTEPQQQSVSLSASTTSLDAKLSNNHNWQSVADRINELEKQQQKQQQQQQQAIHDHNKQQYTFLDPSKTHRVPNPTLKAFQKNAIQSYFERQQQQQLSIRLSKTHHVRGSSGNKSDDLGKMKSIGGLEMTKSNGNIAPRPQSLNLGLAASAVSLPSTPSSASSGSQRSSISAWPNVSPTTTNPSIMIGSKTASADSGAMMKNANDIAKMNMKNSAMSSAAALSEKQLFASNKGNNGKSQSINNKNLFTSFCEIKTENHPSAFEGTTDNNGANKTNLNPPPLPRKSVLRRTSSASEYSSIRDQMLQQNQHLSKDLLGAMIIGQIISIDDWVPERPPKNPSMRIPSPDLPPPPNVENIPHFNQDDPLPPPPPELLKPEQEMKLNPASRRNSFAGQSTNLQSKVKANNIPISPPAIPMRPKIVPTPIMTVNPVKNICQMPQEQTVHAQRVIVPKSDDQHQQQQQQQQTSPRTPSGRASDSRVSVRKRAHNSKDCIGYIPAQQLMTPPPLKPRMRNQNEISTQPQQQNVFTPIVNKVRSNSKASYLPRQQREKLLDPDHGSYKLTLHELNDNIKENFQEEISKCNLPDVLPVTVKYHNSYRHTHHHHRQPPPHHQSQNFTPQPHYHPIETHMTPQTAPVLTSNALKSIFQFAMGNSGSSTPSNTSSSASSSPLIPTSPFNGSTTRSPLSTPPASLQSPKYTSQSSIDLKMTQVIDPKLYTNDELIKTYHQQKEACRELNKTILSNSLQATSVNECDNKIAVVRKLNMVESPDASPKNSIESLFDKKTTSTESLKSLEEKAMSEKSEKEIKTAEKVAAKKDEEVKVVQTTTTTTTTTSLSDTDDALKTTPVAVQKTEIVLRVYPIMQEMGCQTDETSEVHEDSISTVHNDDDLEKPSKVNLWSTPQKRKKHPEELDFENLSKDLASQLSPSDKLHSILVPKTIKSSSDYISDLFKINITSRPTKKDVSTSTLEKSVMKSSMEVLTSNSTYFSISEPKAKLMTRYSREMTLINSDSSDLTKKKEELVERLGKKLKVLETEQTMLAEESNANDTLGHDVAFKVAQKVRPGDSTKFRSYVDDVGYITMLLLSLSGRLARTENALHTIGDKATADKKILETKRDRLLEQLDEAKQLKEDIDRRGTNLSKILQKSLTVDEYSDYDYFINMKAKLIVDSREIADKIKLGEEQLNSLKDTLVHSEC